MKIKLLTFGILGISLVSLLQSCKSDDADAYTPINIIAEADVSEGFQDETLTIPIFDNDQNIPENATVQIEGLGTGAVQLLDPNNTPNTILDDVIEYVPNANYSETDTFQYTICDEEGMSCDSAEVSIKIYKPLNIDLGALPYEKLSDYNFFYASLANQEPVPGVLPYEPISTLFTDYAHKKRFVWMPKGVSAEYVGDGDLLNFPDGAILVKTFYYDNVLPSNTTQIIETRLLIKRGGTWEFADYIWDEAQQEAILNTSGNGANVPIEWVQNGETRSINYRIPSTAECFICHKNSDQIIPIGPKPQNLNGNYQDGLTSFNQLQRWIEEGYLMSNLPPNIETVIDWEDTSEAIELRVRSYMDINCAHCHVDGGHCGARSIRLAFRESSDLENMGVCSIPDMPIPGYDDTTLIVPGEADNSILFFRVATTQEEYRMPMTGRTIAHDEFVTLLEEWINSLTITCD